MDSASYRRQQLQLSMKHELKPKHRHTASGMTTHSNVQTARHLRITIQSQHLRKILRFSIAMRTTAHTDLSWDMVLSRLSMIYDVVYGSFGVFDSYTCRPAGDTCMGRDGGEVLLREHSGKHKGGT